MALLKLKDLHNRLEYVDDFEDPKIELEQYITTPHIAGKSSSCWELQSLSHFTRDVVE